MSDLAVSPDQPPCDPASQVTVCIAPDGLSARVSFAPAPAGAAIGRDHVLAALQAAGVVHGVSIAAIDDAVAWTFADAALVAEGRAPVPGRDASFELLIPDAKSRAPKVDEHGTVDFRDLGRFFSVKAGTPLMRRTPATPGVDGIDVLGRPLAAVPGVDTPFAPQLRGAAINPRDATLLEAAITGQPVLVTHGVSVEPTLTLPAVDLSTGHVSFEGSVTVLGDVKAGMKIEATGDVTVGGVVEAAQIHAAGDVTIRGGIIGHGEWSEAADDGADTARIVCGGTLHTRFAENASVEAGGCIFVQDAVRQSRLSATSKVMVGPDDGSRGQIIGGRTLATLRVQAAVLGSPAGVRTVVEVGVNPALSQRLATLRARLQQLAKERADVAQLLAYARANPQRIGPEMLAKAERTAASLAHEWNDRSAAEQVLQAQIGLAADAVCVVGQKVHAGTQVRIGELCCDVDDERGRGVFARANGQLDFSGSRA